MNTIDALFENVVKAHRDAPAILENDRTLTFGELSEMAEKTLAIFPKKAKTVGIVLEHGALMIAAILAVLRCGGCYIPAEPLFPTGRIHHMMTEAKVDFILTERHLADKLAGFSLCFLDGARATPRSLQKSTPGITADTPAYVLYTSGTTGRPKGVCVTHQNVCHYVRAFANEFHPAPGDRMLQYSPCTFDIFVEEIFASLLNGAALAIPDESDKADVFSLMRFVERHGVTMLSGFPYLLAELNRLPKIPSSLRLLISGGDVLRGTYVDKLLQKAQVYNTYGPSETTVCASYYRCNDGYILPDGTYPIGRPVQGATIEILDEHGKPVPKGSVGEICISGGGVSLGYIGDHAEENRAFARTADGGVLYHSGDMGQVLPDGNIAFHGRRDSQIMIYGKRVEVSEVESWLSQCAGVRQALVRAFQDEDGLAYMTAYVVGDDTLKLSKVRQELSHNLTSFMIPEYFVKLRQIPLGLNGKPDERRLPVVMKAGTLP